MVMIEEIIVTTDPEAIIFTKLVELEVTEKGQNRS